MDSTKLSDMEVGFDVGILVEGCGDGRLVGLSVGCIGILVGFSVGCIGILVGFSVTSITLIGAGFCTDPFPDNGSGSPALTLFALVG